MAKIPWKRFSVYTINTTHQLYKCAIMKWGFFKILLSNIIFKCIYPILWRFYSDCQSFVSFSQLHKWIFVTLSQRRHLQNSIRACKIIPTAFIAQLLSLASVIPLPWKRVTFSRETFMVLWGFKVGSCFHRLGLKIDPSSLIRFMILARPNQNTFNSSNLHGPSAPRRLHWSNRQLLSRRIRIWTKTRWSNDEEADENK